MSATKPSPNQHDPLIVALFGKLPPECTPFPLDRRLAWLRMAAMTFDLVYGVEEGVAVVRADGRDDLLARISRNHADPPTVTMGETVRLPKDPARLPRARAPDQMFVIDLDGVAWGRDAPLSLSAVGQGDPVWDFRPGEQGLENVIWAEPVNGKIPPLTIFKA